MKIDRLRLINYRRFHDADIAFPEGTIGIVGRNGAGKSSLIEAILWTLFGHDAARTSKDLLKRAGAAPGDDVVTQLDVRLDGSRLRITRRLRGRNLQPEATIEGDGNVLVAPGANSWEQANQFLVRLLGFDRAAFEATVVAKQGELAALSELRPAQRKRVLLGLLGVDRIENAVQAARQDARVLEARVQESRRLLDSEDPLRAALADATRQADETESRAQALGAESASAERRLASLCAREADLLAARLRDQELRVRLQALQGRLESGWSRRTRLAGEGHLLRERVAETAASRARLDAIGDVDAALLASIQRRDGMQRRRALEARAALLRPRMGEAPPTASRAAEEDVEARLRDRRTAHLAANRSLSDLDARLRHAGGRIDELAASVPAMAHADPDAPCPTCGRELGDVAHRLLERHSAAVREHEARCAAARAEHAALAADQARAAELVNRLREELETLERKHGALRAVREQCEEAVRRHEVLRLELERIDTELRDLPSAPWDEAAHQSLLLARTERDALRDRVARVEEAARRIERIQDEDRLLAAQEQEILRERETLSRELKTLGYEQGSWENVHQEAEASRRALEGIQRELAQLRERLAAWTRERDRLNRDLTLLEQHKASIKTHVDRLVLLEALAGRRGDDGVLPEFRTHLIGRLRPALAHAASDLLSQMTRQRYTQIALDDEYEASLFDGAASHPMERFSGGEVDVANLALRLAVSELVANARGRSRLGFVALDEVFGSQDEERRRAILDSLHGLSGVFRQVLVVTHNDDVRERLEHVLRVEDAGDGTSRLVASWDAPSGPPAASADLAAPLPASR